MERSSSGGSASARDAPALSENEDNWRELIRPARADTVLRVVVVSGNLRRNLLPRPGDRLGLRGVHRADETVSDADQADARAGSLDDVESLRIDADRLVDESGQAAAGHELRDEAGALVGVRNPRLQSPVQDGGDGRPLLQVDDLLRVGRQRAVSAQAPERDAPPVVKGDVVGLPVETVFPGPIETGALVRAPAETRAVDHTTVIRDVEGRSRSSRIRRRQTVSSWGSGRQVARARTRDSVCGSWSTKR